MNNQNPTNQEVSILVLMLNRVKLSTTPDHLKKPLYDLKMAAIKANEEYEEEKLVCCLMNGGIEVEEQGKPTNTFAMPKYPIRDETKGADEAFTEKIKKISEQKHKYKEDMYLLQEKKSKLKVSRILTEDEFNTLLYEIDVLELECLRNYLVKQPKE